MHDMIKGYLQWCHVPALPAQEFQSFVPNALEYLLQTLLFDHLQSTRIINKKKEQNSVAAKSSIDTRQEVERTKTKAKYHS